MKKLLTILTLTLCLFAFTSCATKKDDAQNNQNQEESKLTGETQEIAIKFPFGELTGQYTGELKEGLPEGYGKFETTNNDGTGWYYEGDFKDGHFNGEGKTVWTSGQIQEGTYIDDIWNPNALNYYKFLGTVADSSYTIPEKALQFLTDHDDFFPAESADKLSDYIDGDLDYNKLKKDMDKYGDKYMSLSNLTIAKADVFMVTENPSRQDDLMCTYVKAYDENGQVYTLYYRGEIKDLNENDSLSLVIGLPIGLEEVKEADGSTSQIPVFAASILEKTVSNEEVK